MKKKLIRLAIILVLLISMFSMFQFIPNTHASTIEEVYTNSFDSRVVAWAEVGSSPYLDNSDANYILADTNGQTEGDWHFANSAGSGTIVSVKLRFEARVTVVGGGSFRIYVWNGASWVNVGVFTLTTSYAWYEKDVSATLTTWSKINGAEVYVVYERYTGVPIVYVRRLTRKVEWTPPAEERSFTFMESITTTSSLNQWQEQKRTFIETITSISTSDQWQEQKYVFQQIITSSEIVTVYQEQFYRFAENGKAMPSSIYQQEQNYIFTQVLESFTTSHYGEEQFYRFAEIIKLFETEIHAIELKIIFSFSFTESINTRGLMKNLPVLNAPVEWVQIHRINIYPALFFGGFCILIFVILILTKEKKGNV